MADAYKELLETCAYTDREIDKEMPRVKKFFGKTGLTEKDAKRGKETLLKYYQCDKLRGMRMNMGVLMKSTVDIALSRDEGKRIFYTELPNVFIASLLGGGYSVDPDMIVASPGTYFLALLGGVFGNLDRMYTWAEKNMFTPGAAHCGCNMTIVGGRGLGAIPPGDLTISQGLYCDEAPKTGELINYMFEEEVFYVNRAQDEYLFEPPGGEKQLAYLAESNELLRQKLSNMLGREVTDEMVKKSLGYYLQIMAKLKEILEIRVMADPQVLNVQSYNHLYFIHVFCPGEKGFEERMEAMQVLVDELKTMVDRGEGIMEKGAPRVVYAPLMPLVDPGFGKVLEDAGINLCCPELYSRDVVSVEQMNAMMEMPVSAIFAMMWICVPFWFIHLRSENIVQNYKNADLDGVILLAHYPCRIVGSDMIMLKDAVRKELGPDVPLALVDYDIYDYRCYNHQQARTRLESFAEMVKSAKAMKKI